MTSLRRCSRATYRAAAGHLQEIAPRAFRECAARLDDASAPRALEVDRHAAATLLGGVDQVDDLLECHECHRCLHVSRPALRRTLTNHLLMSSRLSLSIAGSSAGTRSIGMR